MRGDQNPSEMSMDNGVTLPGKPTDIGRSSFIRERLARPILDAEAIEEADAALHAPLDAQGPFDPLRYQRRYRAQP